MKAGTIAAGAVAASRVYGTWQPVRLDRWLLQGSVHATGNGCGGHRHRADRTALLMVRDGAAHEP